MSNSDDDDDNDNNNDDDDDDEIQTLASLETEVATVVAQLLQSTQRTHHRPSSVPVVASTTTAAASSSRPRTTSSSINTNRSTTGSNSTVVGRGSFLSIGHAIQSLRNRTDRLQRSCTTTTDDGDIEEDEDDDVARGDCIRTLSERLDLVQLSHSERIPLNLLLVDEEDYDEDDDEEENSSGADADTSDEEEEEKEEIPRPNAVANETRSSSMNVLIDGVDYTPSTTATTTRLGTASLRRRRMESYHRLSNRHLTTTPIANTTTISEHTQETIAAMTITTLCSSSSTTQDNNMIWRHGGCEDGDDDSDGGDGEDDDDISMTTRRRRVMTSSSYSTSTSMVHPTPSFSSRNNMTTNRLTTTGSMRSTTGSMRSSALVVSRSRPGTSSSMSQFSGGGGDLLLFESLGWGRGIEVHTPGTTTTTTVEEKEYTPMDDEEKVDDTTTSDYELVDEDDEEEEKDPQHQRDDDTDTNSSTDTTDVETPVLLPRSSIFRKTSGGFLPGSIAIHQDLLLPSNSLAPDEEDDEFFQQTAFEPDKEEEYIPPNYTKPLIYSWGYSLTSNERSLHSDPNPSHTHHTTTTPPTTIASNPPALVTPGPQNRIARPTSYPIISIATSSTHSACADSNGNVFLCGTNISGCIDPTDRTTNDDGTPSIVNRPMKIDFLPSLDGQRRIRQLSCGKNHTAALTSIGSVFTWGGNEMGQLGHEGAPATGYRQPRVFGIISSAASGRSSRQRQRAASVSCGDGCTVVLSTRSTVYAAGISVIAGVGAATTVRTIPVLEGLPISSVAMGDRHCVVLTTHGTAYAWGGNEYGECGRPYPLELAGRPVPIGVGKTERRKKSIRMEGEEEELFDNWGVWDEGDEDDGRGVSIGLASDVFVVHAACGRDHTVLVTKSGDLLVCGRFHLTDEDDDGSMKSMGALCSHQECNSFTSVQRVKHPNNSGSDTKRRQFTSAEAGDGHTLLLDDVGDLYQMFMSCGTTTTCDDNNNDNNNYMEEKQKHLLLSELVPLPVLTGRNILTIAAGGKECIAIAAPPSSYSGTVGDSGPIRAPMLQRQFSIISQSNDDVEVVLNRRDGEVDIDGDIASSLAGGGFEDLLKLLVEDSDDDGGKRDKAARELANRIEELLKHPSVLNSLFMDPDELYRMHRKLLLSATVNVNQCTKEEGIEEGGAKGRVPMSYDVRKTIAKAVLTGITKGLEGIRDRGTRLIYPEAVRCLLLYVHFFDWIDILDEDDDDDDDDDEKADKCGSTTDKKSTSPLSFVLDPRGECIQSLCETILSLPFEGYKALCTWATTVYNHHHNDDNGNSDNDHSQQKQKLFVQMLVHPLLKQLNSALKVTIDDDDVEHWRPSRQAIPVIVNVLRWLYAVSTTNGGGEIDDYGAGIGGGNNVLSPLAEPKDFYSTGLDSIPMTSLYKDHAVYMHALQHGLLARSTFFLTAHPFIFHPFKKRELLHLENEVDMYRTATESSSYDAETQETTIDAYFVLEIDRENLFEQTLEKLREVDSANELRKKLRVVFRGEAGVDAGGLTKEFFQLLSEDLFDVGSSLWSGRYGETITWFNADCTWDDGGYEMVGLLVGLALYNGVLLDVNFPPTFYRKLLGLPLGLEDMVDEDLKRSLGQLLDYKADDVEDVFCVNFEVTWRNLGQEQTVELKPGGSGMPVTNENREEYVLLYVQWLLVDSIAHQWDAFQLGIVKIMETSSTLSLFRPEELEVLVVGTPDLDWYALQNNVKYEGGYDADSDVIKLFWKYTLSIERDTQINLLKFVTGCGRAPIGGLGALPFLIQRAGPDSHELPTSHTCFNILMLPDYTTYAKLEEKLGRAIVECEGFGLE